MALKMFQFAFRRSLRFTPPTMLSLFANKAPSKAQIDHGSSPSVNSSPMLRTGDPDLHTRDALPLLDIGNNNHSAHLQLSDLALPIAEQTEVPPCNLHALQKEARSETKAPRPWRPFALQRYVLYGFCATLCFLIIGIEVIFIVSEKSQGLATTTSTNWLYLYVYGPTALFTLLAAAWISVYHEAKVIAPWIRAQASSAKAEDWLLLDYVSMFSLTVPFRALHNRDFLVAISAIISQLLTILVVVSSSLIRSAPLGMSQPVKVRSQIIDDPSRLSGSGLTPLFVSIGLSRHGLDYPDDIVDMVALQSISPPSEMLLELHATVDGFAAGLDCQAALMENLSWNAAVPLTQFDALEMENATVDLSVHDCSISASIPPPIIGSSEASSTRVFGRLLSGQCAGSSSLDVGSKRLVFIFGNVTSGDHITLSDSTQIICKPSYSVSKYEVSQTRGHSRTISLAENPPTTKLDHLRSWNLAQAILDAYDSIEGGLLNNIVVDFLDEFPLFYPFPDLDGFSAIILGLHNTSFPTQSSVFNATLLTSALQDYFKIHVAYLVRDALFRPTNLIAVGYTKVQVNRLLVQTLASQTIVTLCVIAVLLLIWMLTVLPADLSLAGNPGTLIGIAALSAPVARKFPRGLSFVSPQIMADLIRGPEGSTPKSKRREQNQQHDPEAMTQELHQNEMPTLKSNSLGPKLHHPLTLRTISQIGVYIVLLGLTFALENLLRHSKDHQGIGEVPQYSYYHYLWTSLPAGVLSIIGFFFSSVDLERRILAPFYALNRGPTSINRSINLSLLGLPTPQALYRQTKTGNYASALATVAAFLTSSLTIVSGSLFYETLSFNIPGKLILIGSFVSSLHDPGYFFMFGLSRHLTEYPIVSTLILESNLSYPSFTFEQFSLPELAWDDSSVPTWSNMTGLETHAVVPALQGGLSCHQHSKSDIMAELVYFDPSKEGIADEFSWPAGERVRVNVTGEYCLQYPSSHFDYSASAIFFLGEDGTEDGIFGVAHSGENSLRQSCSTYFYVWGSFTRGTSPVVSASAMSCNASVSAVDIEVVLSGPEFTISENHRPRPVKGTEHDIIPANNSTAQFEFSVYQDLTSMNESLLDPFFSLLVHSRYAIPISTLADPTQQNKVADGIIFHHKIIAAQTLSMTARIPSIGHSEDPGIFAWTGQGKVNDTTFPATIIGNPYSLSSRVVQNATATRVLETLLITIVATGLLGWALGEKKGVLPRPPTSVASTLAMLADGNLLEFWNHETNETTQTTVTDIIRTFGEMRVFRLGLPNRKHNFGIWVADGSGELGQTLKHIAICRSDTSDNDSCEI
ncbi:hypothetical protein F4860DRAFT_487910 [Xylaria cubensis]|nr:hypothetical protein F4860DRAFT_487910 [Xylaria cubensis]